MSDLYTSQVHLKRLLQGQATAAFTPAPEAVLNVLDPAFFPGMGALNEDEKGRLQCPVRGCGSWHRSLAPHLAHAHRSIGGPQALRLALDIPRSVPLLSMSERAKFRSRFEGVDMPARWGAKARVVGMHRLSSSRKREYRARSAQSRHSIAAKNLNDTCVAQLQAKVAACARAISRSPSQTDFEKMYGLNVLYAVKQTFGSWNNAKAQIGLALSPAPRHSSPFTVNLICEALREWRDHHGDLPLVTDTQNPSRVPQIPSYTTILRAFGVDTWDAAMRSAIEHLQIKSERYGSPRRGVA
jgi:hypothetical protein